MLDEYIAHGDLVLDDLLYSGDELYHWKLGFSMPNHKWIERLGTPGHYIYKYADDLHEALTGDRLKKNYTYLAQMSGHAAAKAKTAAENTAAAAIVANAIGKTELAKDYRAESLYQKDKYEHAERKAKAYQEVIKSINNLPINRLRRGVKNLVWDTAENLSDLVNKGNDFLQGLFGKKKKKKPRSEPSRPDRPHQRKKTTQFGTSNVKKKKKVEWYEGWGNATGQQILDNASGKRQ